MSNQSSKFTSGGVHTVKINSPYRGIGAVTHEDKFIKQYRILGSGLRLTIVELEKGWKRTRQHAFDPNSLVLLDLLPPGEYTTMSQDNRWGVVNKTGNRDLLTTVLPMADQQIVDELSSIGIPDWWKHIVYHTHYVENKTLKSYGLCIRFDDDEIVKRFVMLEKHF